MNPTLFPIFSALCGYTQAKEDHEAALARFPLGTPNRPVKHLRELHAARDRAQEVLLNTLCEHKDELRELART